MDVKEFNHSTVGSLDCRSLVAFRVHSETKLYITRCFSKPHPQQSLLKKSRESSYPQDLSSSEEQPTTSHDAQATASRANDPSRAETQFNSRLPLPFRIFSSFFIVFLNNSELLCYFAMTLVAIEYGSLFAIVYPITALLWGMLSCPRPSKTFWLFAISYTEVLLLFL